MTLRGMSNAQCFINIVDFTMLASIESTLCLYHICIIIKLAFAVNPLYPVHITMLIDIKLTSCLHYVPSILLTSSTSSTSQCWSTSCLHHTSFILLTSSTLLIWQCWPTLSRHCVYNVCLLSCLHHQHRNVNQYWINIVSTLCLYCMSSFLFTHRHRSVI